MASPDQLTLKTIQLNILLMTKLSLGFIGFGNMATAIFDGLTKSHNTFSKVYVYEKAKKSLPKNIISTTHNDLIIKSDIIIKFNIRLKFPFLSWLSSFTYLEKSPKLKITTEK